MTVRLEPIGYVTYNPGALASLLGPGTPPFYIDRWLSWYSATRDGFESRLVRTAFVRGYGDTVRSVGDDVNRLTAEVLRTFSARAFLFCLTMPPGWRLIGLSENASTYYAHITNDPTAETLFPLSDGPYGPTPDPLPLDTDLPPFTLTAAPAPCDRPSVLTFSGFGEQFVTVGATEYEGFDGQGRPVMVLAPGAERLRGSGTVELRPGLRYGVAAPGFNPFAFGASACTAYSLRGSEGGGEPLQQPEPVGGGRRDLRNVRGLHRLAGRGLAAHSDTAAHPVPGVNASQIQEVEL